mmetsp:Transcript_16661/g.31517  ORF Transcript_16661/g.31517 Transcript_16661/m.31517 type:complete len:138 (+) Transcript_16661:73-486(+)
MYANQACCACGGGAAPGNEKRKAKIARNIKKSKALIQNRCMLARCSEFLGECQMKLGCIKALGRVSNATCELENETIDECAARYSSDISIGAQAALKDVMECAGVQDKTCESEESGGGGETPGGSSGKGDSGSGKTT